MKGLIANYNIGLSDVVKPSVLVAKSHVCGKCEGVKISFDQTGQDNEQYSIEE